MGFELQNVETGGSGYDGVFNNHVLRSVTAYAVTGEIGRCEDWPKMVAWLKAAEVKQPGVTAIVQKRAQNLVNAARRNGQTFASVKDSRNYSYPKAVSQFTSLSEKEAAKLLAANGYRF